MIYTHYRVVFNSDGTSESQGKFGDVWVKLGEVNMAEDKFKMAKVSDFKDPENRWRFCKEWGLDVNPAGWVWADEIERKICDLPFLYGSSHEGEWAFSDVQLEVDTHRCRMFGVEVIPTTEPQTDRDWLKKIASTSEMGEIFMCLKEIKKYLEETNVGP